MSDSHVLRALKEKFQTFSPQLRKASRYIVDNPNEIAMHSMRAVAAQAGVQPSVMIRLAKAIGFESYEPFREHFRSWMSKGTNSWELRVRKLTDKANSEQNLFESAIQSDIASISRLLTEDTIAAMKDAVKLINASEKVYVFGLRSMFSASYYFNYLMRLFSSKTVLITGLGGATADALRDITDKDALVIFSLQPYTQAAVTAVQFARERKAGIVAITDSEVSPVVSPAGPNIVVTSSTDALLPSIIPVTAVGHLLATMVLVSTAGEDALDHIKRSMTQLEHFNVYLP